MIRNLGKLFLVLCFLVVGSGFVAKAEILGVNRIDATVPFAFVVGKTILPAGQYEIKQAYDDIPTLLMLRSTDGRESVLFETENVETRGDQPARHTELVFDKVAGQIFLSKIWVSGDAFGNKLPKSKMEKRLARSAEVGSESVVGIVTR